MFPILFACRSLPGFLLLYCQLIAGLQTVARPKELIKIYPAPKGEMLDSRYVVTAAGKKVPVYSAKVGAADEVRLRKAMDDKAHSAEYFDTAAFASFDLLGDAATITVTVPVAVSSVKLLPASARVVPVVKGRTISFRVTHPGSFTVEINGEEIRSLHVFVNPPEEKVPQAKDPNVIYFGPGIHEVSQLVVGDNQTVYLAGGAIVRAVIGPGEKYTVNAATGLRSYAPTFLLKGRNITFRGRGMIDAGACPTHARNMIMVTGSNIRLEGVILRDAGLWTVPVRRSDSVTITNLKLLGYRANSDGIDICNSRNVTVENCFIRTLDDLVVIKADQGQGEVKNILVKNCVLWNQFAHALSVGAEIRENVENVLFTNNDIIHDKGREWSLRIYHCDAARISNVRFEHIRIAESRQCISLWIGKAVWSRDAERGNIKGVSFKDIQVSGPGNPMVSLAGFDDAHQVEQVLFDAVTINQKALARENIRTNAFVKDVLIKP